VPTLNGVHRQGHRSDVDLAQMAASSQVWHIADQIEPQEEATQQTAVA